jgi:hypothetical protein
MPTLSIKDAVYTLEKYGCVGTGWVRDLSPTDRFIQVMFMVGHHGPVPAVREGRAPRAAPAHKTRVKALKKKRTLF